MLLSTNLIYKYGKSIPSRQRRQQQQHPRRRFDLSFLEGCTAPADPLLRLTGKHFDRRQVGSPQKWFRRVSCSIYGRRPSFPSAPEHTKMATQTDGLPQQLSNELDRPLDQIVDQSALVVPIDFSSGRCSHQMRRFTSAGWPESAGCLCVFSSFSLSPRFLCQ
jgi:hypothetical protein